MARREAIPFPSGLVLNASTSVDRTGVPGVRPNVALLRFALPRTTAATVCVFAENGSLVRRVLVGEIAAGEHACGWDGHDDRDVPVTSGVYLVRLEVNGRVVTSRRVVVA